MAGWNWSPVQNDASFVKLQSKDIVGNDTVCWLNWPRFEEQIHEQFV